LEAQGNLSPDQAAYLSNHTVSVAETAGEYVTKGTNEDNEEDARLVKGKTLFQDVLDWGLSKETIEEVIGGKMPHPLTNIRDHVLEKELEFGTIKQALQEKVDELDK